MKIAYKKPQSESTKLCPITAYAFSGLTALPACGEISNSCDQQENGGTGVVTLGFCAQGVEEGASLDGSSVHADCTKGDDIFLSLDGCHVDHAFDGECRGNLPIICTATSDCSTFDQCGDPAGIFVVTPDGREVECQEFGDGDGNNNVP